VPFRGDSEWEVLKKHETEAPHFPARLTASERDILSRCLAKDPAQRFQTVAELLRALQAPVALGESLLLTGMVGAPPAAQQQSAPPPLPRRPSLGDPDDAPLRDVSQSPYGLPWREDGRPRGPIALLVRGIFRLVELCVFLVLLPVRAISTVGGRGVLWLLQLPFRILGAAAKLTGYLLVASLVLVAILGALKLFVH
jgi:hypothetical protein